MSKHFTTTARIALMASTALLLPQAAFAQDATAGDEQDEQTTIVVTGFRESLNAAIAAKRESVSQVDVIVAEDIAKFPDTNLAESLQRIPGIAIQRDAGEGRAITVRGLGPRFTRVRVNGMESVASSTDGASANRERGFDFNVFGSELFSSIVVHKTASASLDEGSLGAVVDLNTGNPLAYETGLHFVGSAQARYNDLSDDLGPRVAGLLSWVNPDGTFGASASLAYSQYKTSELGNNTVRWAQAAFRSVEGTPCFNADSTYAPSDVCDEAALAFHPRIPRYGLVDHDRERLGATASIQWAPSDSTTLSVDGLYSNFKETRDEYWGEVLFRSNERFIDIVDYTIDSNNNMIAGTINNAWVRTERYSRESETEFYQISGRLEQQVTDRLKATLRAGTSRSDADIPVETTLIFDDRDFMGYSFDYSNMNTPELTFGGGIDDPAQFQLAEFRDRPSFLTNKFTTVGADVEWEVADFFNVEAGAIYRRFTFDTIGFGRDSSYCGAFTCAPGQYGLPVTSGISEQFELGEAGQPAGNTNSWVVPNLDAAADAVNLYGREALLRQGEDRAVTEEATGAYAQFGWDGDVAGLRVTGNAGVRYVKTDQSSTGFVSGTEVTVERSYSDWLPSGNLNVFLTDDLILRGAVAKVITRPTLGSLTPGGGVDQFNFRVTSGNPFLNPVRAMNYDAALEWYFAPGAIASVALFAKDITSFPISGSTTGTYAESGLPTSLLTPGTPAHDAVVVGLNPNQLFEFRTQVDGPGASVKGVEFSLNLPFSVFTEGLLSNFGVLGNLTLVDSDVDYTLRLPGTTINPANGNIILGPQEVFSRPLIDLAKKAWNGTVYYEDDRFSARVSAAWRDGYISGTSGNSNLFEGYASSFNVDASIRYKVTEMIELSLEGTNLTDNYRERWVNDPAKRGYENNHYGRVFMAGVRVQM
jgi:TonB-dependent receptor